MEWFVGFHFHGFPTVSFIHEVIYRFLEVRGVPIVTCVSGVIDIDIFIIDIVIEIDIDI